MVTKYHSKASSRTRFLGERSYKRGLETKYVENYIEFTLNQITPCIKSPLTDSSQVVMIVRL